MRLSGLAYGLVTDLHEVDGGESPQPRLVTRSTRRTVGESLCPRSERCRRFLSPARSRATHITGFLDPNRRRTTARSVATYYALRTIAFTRGGVDARVELNNLLRNVTAYPVEASFLMIGMIKLHYYLIT